MGLLWLLGPGRRESVGFPEDTVHWGETVLVISRSTTDVLWVSIHIYVYVHIYMGIHISLSHPLRGCERERERFLGSPKGFTESATHLSNGGLRVCHEFPLSAPPRRLHTLCDVIHKVVSQTLLQRIMFCSHPLRCNEQVHLRKTVDSL